MLHIRNIKESIFLISLEYCNMVNQAISQNSIVLNLFLFSIDMTVKKIYNEGCNMRKNRPLYIKKRGKVV